jgi:hypothetical protein
MLRYFVAANAWLFFGILMVLGQTTVRTSPTYYSFFGFGFTSPAVYMGIQLIAFGTAVLWFWRGISRARDQGLSRVKLAQDELAA